MTMRHLFTLLCGLVLSCSGHDGDAPKNDAVQQLAPPPAQTTKTQTEDEVQSLIRKAESGDFFAVIRLIEINREKDGQVDVPYDRWIEQGVASGNLYAKAFKAAADLSAVESAGWENLYIDSKEEVRRCNEYEKQFLELAKLSPPEEHAAARRFISIGMRQLGELYLHGCPDRLMPSILLPSAQQLSALAIKENKTQALDWFTQAANAGDIASQIALVQIHEAGIIGSPDREQAREWAQRIEGLTDERAVAHAADILTYDADCVFPKNYKRIRTRMCAVTSSASSADLTSVNEIIDEPKWMNVRTPITDGLLVKSFERSAKLGHVKHQFLMGMALGSDSRCDVTPEPVEAAKFLRQAADAQYIPAQYELGLRYAQGAGVPKDYSEAFRLFQAAADNVVPEDPNRQLNCAVEENRVAALSRLGQSYLLGIGVPKNPVVGYAYLNASLSFSDDDLDARRKRLDAWETRLTPEQVSEAQGLSRQWKPGVNLALLKAEGSLKIDSAPHALEAALYGSGFYVTSDGYYVTNAHVIENCAEIRAPKRALVGKVVAKDPVTDLALLKFEVHNDSHAEIRDKDDYELGQSVITFGFPLDGILADTGNISVGSISGLSGIGNDSGKVQISTPIQPGNSGGPLLNAKGQVIGVVVQKLSGLKVVELTGDIPANVAFAIRSRALISFLSANNVPYSSASFFSWSKTPETLAKLAGSYSQKIECWR